MNDFELAEAYTRLTLRGVEAYQRNLTSVQRFTQRTTRHMENMGRIGRRALMVMGPAFAYVIYQAARFSKAMAEVNAYANITERQFKQLSAEARRLGATTEHTASQAAGGMATFAKAGFSANQMFASMAPTLNLATAAEISVGQAAGVAADIMAGMGLQATELTHAVDVLAKAATSVKTELTELGIAMKYVGPVAKLSGLDLEDVVAILQALAAGGYQGSIAGTQLRQVLAQLSIQSGKATKIFKSLNIEIRDLDGRVRPLADLIDDFNQRVDALGPTADKAGLAMEAFGMRGGPGFAKLLEMGGAEIRKYRVNLDDVSGVAMKIAHDKLDTLHGDFVKLKSALESLSIQLGQIFESDLRKVTQRVTNLTTALQNMEESTKRGIATWVEYGGQLALIAASMGTLAKAGAALGPVLAGAAVTGAAYGTAASRAARGKSRGSSFLQEYGMMAEDVGRVIMRVLHPRGEALEGRWHHLEKRKRVQREARRAADEAEAARFAGEPPVELYKHYYKAAQEAVRQMEAATKRYDELFEQRRRQLQLSPEMQAQAAFQWGNFWKMIEPRFLQDVTAAKSALQTARVRYDEYVGKMMDVGIQAVGGIGAQARGFPWRSTFQRRLEEAGYEYSPARQQAAMQAVIPTVQQLLYRPLPGGIARGLAPPVEWYHGILSRQAEHRRRMTRAAETGFDEERYQRATMAELTRFQGVQEAFAERRRRIMEERPGGGAIGVADVAGHLQRIITQAENRQIKLAEEQLKEQKHHSEMLEKISEQLEEEAVPRWG